MESVARMDLALIERSLATVPDSNNNMAASFCVCKEKGRNSFKRKRIKKVEVFTFLLVGYLVMIRTIIAQSSI